MEWRALKVGGWLHPGVSWSRFALAGLIGFVFLGSIVALVLLVPASQPWLEALGLVALVVKSIQVGRRRAADRQPRVP